MPWWDNTEQTLVLAKLDLVLSTIRQMQMQLNILNRQEMTMALDLTAITKEIENNSSVTQSVVTLLGNLTTLIKAIPPSSDPVTQAALDQLTATITANDQAVADAVTANTPAAP